MQYRVSRYQGRFVSDFYWTLEMSEDSVSDWVHICTGPRKGDCIDALRFIERVSGKKAQKILPISILRARR